MFFLAPLYLLAGFAIAGPILFHLIRRTPRGKQVFSSVMFLQPSPPRLTKRSRIEDWLVLILRALAILVLALAFARPYFRTTSLTTPDDSSGRQLVILLDTSASMRRGELWAEAQQRVQTAVGDLQPLDTVTCLSFDRTQTPIMLADEWQQLPEGERKRILVDRIESTSPSWEQTNLAAALICAADQLDQATVSARGSREILLVSDLQRGTGWEDLQAYNWPEAVQLKLLAVGDGESPNNVAVHVVEDVNAVDDAIRVRVSNAIGSSESLFLLSWGREYSGASEAASDQELESIPVQVPPGQSRVVRVPKRDSANDVHRLQLTGDEHEFDNTCYVANKGSWPSHVVWIGEPGTTESSPRFFLEPLFPPTPRRTTQVLDWSPQSPADLPEAATLIVCGVRPDAAQEAWLRVQLELGSSVLYVGRDAEQTAGVFSLVNVAPVAVVDEEAADYFMLGAIDFAHPLTRPFDDPRFSDFSKLRFWKRRKLTDLDATRARVILEFDDQSPALVHWTVGRGNVFLMTSSWTRDDSEVALWSKFPPLMNSLLELGRPSELTRLQYVVGENISLGESAEHEFVVQQGREAPRTLSPEEPLRFERPGMVRLASSVDELPSSQLEFAVNLAASESDIVRLTKDDFATVGIQVEAASGTAQVVDPARQRQLLNAELESQQQWWRWLLVASLVLLLAETVLSSRPARVPGVTA